MTPDIAPLLGPEFVFSGQNFDYADARAVIFGVPWDSTTSFKPGARLGPDSIREASRQIWGYSPRSRREHWENARQHDVGDVLVTPGDANATLERVEQLASAVSTDGKIPIAMGGEHTLTLGTVKALAARKPVVVYFDAHPDMLDEYNGDKVCHATTLRRIAGFLPPEDIVHVGTRAVGKEEHDFISENAITTLWARDVKTDLPTAVKTIEEKTRGRDVYVSVDIDVFDMPLVPATGTPEPDGLDYHQVVSLLDAVRGRVVGLDVVEVCRDADMLTPTMAAKTLFHALATMKF
jgi:agmatinase